MRIRINEPRTVRAGRFEINVRSRPLEFNLDPIAIAEGPARALRDAIAAGIRAITQSVAPATLRYRAEARRALARGAGWALERFGRSGAPDGDRLFQGSGELAAHLEVRGSGDGFQIVAPSDRLDAPGTTAAALLERLAELVPALRDPFSNETLRAAIAEAWASVLARRL